MDVDKILINKVVAYIKQLDLSNDQAHAYIYLLKNGPSTVLSISRGLNTGRTKLYPLLEDLAEKQLIHIHERHYGTSYEAQSPEVLEFLVQEKERKIGAIKHSLPAALNILQKIKLQSPSSTKIIEYRGTDGLKQMNFNLSKATAEFRVFELAGLDKHLGKHFAQRMRDRFKDRKLRSFDLTNNPNRANEPGNESPHAKTRYIDPSIFKIEFETYIYDNVIGLLSYEDNDIFGVEIYNDKLAKQQTQLFNLLWNQAKQLN